jgi:hypothetical protein
VSHTDLADHIIAELHAENLLLRQLLWAWHGCSPVIRYGDDGELQCASVAEGHPAIDFKRDSAEAIQTALQEPSLRFIQQHQHDVCSHCGVTRWTWDASKPCSNCTHEWMTPAAESSAVT